ncbi:Hypothetical protein, predicted transmembrane protein [Mycoplasma yeatsii 13926]|uniref:Transmembrane protein n=1 Tax=Mycoplasma yeatsii 13926 TaxID=1188240 RepID=S6G3T2_9MOLU|nr:Hypothetical protein, predicted transmembrane protein [Mycoplasma yeatsii 13926]
MIEKFYCTYLKLTITSPINFVSLFAVILADLAVISEIVTSVSCKLIFGFFELIAANIVVGSFCSISPKLVILITFFRSFKNDEVNVTFTWPLNLSFFDVIRAEPSCGDMLQILISFMFKFFVVSGLAFLIASKIVCGFASGNEPSSVLLITSSKFWQNVYLTVNQLDQ